MGDAHRLLWQIGLGSWAGLRGKLKKPTTETRREEKNFAAEKPLKHGGAEVAEGGYCGDPF